MKHFLLGIAIITILMSACSWLDKGQQVTVTDKETGTSITVSEDSVKVEGTLDFGGARVEISDTPEETPDM